MGLALPVGEESDLERCGRLLPDLDVDGRDRRGLERCERSSPHIRGRLDGGGEASSDDCAWGSTQANSSKTSMDQIIVFKKYYTD